LSGTQIQRKARLIQWNFELTDLLSSCNGRIMQIQFFDLLEAEGWDPVSYDQSNPNYSWGGDGSLDDAPVDVKATFDGASWVSTRVDADFTMRGVRWRPNFTVPWHSHNLRQLIIVMGGELTVEDEDGEKHTVKAGDFWISEANTKQTFTAGAEGVTYVETWPVWVQLYTTWYPGEGWIAR
jgi:quercetin dioxygenase-like cupin family protein